MSYPVTNEHIRDLSDEVVLAALMRARDSHPLLDKSDQRGLGLAAPSPEGPLYLKSGP